MVFWQSVLGEGRNKAETSFTTPLAYWVKGERSELADGLTEARRVD
jgi:hypothetical protein